MKKYHLVVKDKYMDKTLYFPKPIDSHQNTNKISNCLSYNNSYFEFIGNKPKEMTIEEINELPYGFVNMFNIVEVREKKYHWRVKDEHLVSFENYYGIIYLNQSTDNGDLNLNDKKSNRSFNTKFTEEKAKELLGDEFNKFEKEECE